MLLSVVAQGEFLFFGLCGLSPLYDNVVVAAHISAFCACHYRRKQVVDRPDQIVIIKKLCQKNPIENYSSRSDFSESNHVVRH